MSLLFLISPSAGWTFINDNLNDLKSAAKNKCYIRNKLAKKNSLKMMYIYTYKNNIHACPTIVGKPDRGGKAKKKKHISGPFFMKCSLYFLVTCRLITFCLSTLDQASP